MGQSLVWIMDTGVLVCGCLYRVTSVLQGPATSNLMSALSSGVSCMGNALFSVLPGPVLTAARTFSTCVPPINERRFAFSHALGASSNPSRLFLRAGRQFRYHRRCAIETSKNHVPTLDPVNAPASGAPLPADQTTV